ncbi:DUF5703 family protein [Tsukamurella paurometabola]|uniref:Dihydroorotate dehydrogenase n=1 Tax=Tsukamurella paurometabola TaxID=2061 RepID=A0A3P8K609_TSUPA|nr:DUF5703 family protein [Tsukamurella paurometabola]MBS4099637.1 hypothetical protein [Tsukamurella paurometabola]UEA83645.1 DUF5703 family protein [Tsukamurella paurometabola]VDR40779.1 Uncharacterised protein [Tsukamurella paurometabola]
MTMSADARESGGFSDEEYDFLPLRLPREVSRVTAAMRLAIEAEFGGWELSRVRLYTDGSRRVLLRRKRTKTSGMLPPDATKGL